LKTARLLHLFIFAIFSSLIILFTSASLSGYKTVDLSPPIIQIKSPGTGSKVTSPFLLEANYICSADGLSTISMTDANNDLLFRKILRSDCSSGEVIDLKLPVYFDTPKENFLSRISINLNDPFNRPLALSSVDVRLVTNNELILAVGENKPAIKITAPQEGAVINGNSIFMSGEILPASDRAVILEIMTQSGKIIGTAQVPILQITEGEYFPFTAQITTKSINEKTNVRLIVRQLGSLITVDTAIHSVEFFLEP